MAIEVTSTVLSNLLALSRAAHPLECCGILLGSEDRIDGWVAAANVHPDPTRHFEIDPAVLIAAQRSARSGGPMVAGYYHSHPVGAPEPSATDRAMAPGDDAIWAILAGDEMRLFRDDGDFKPLPYRIVKA